MTETIVRCPDAAQTIEILDAQSGLSAEDRATLARDIAALPADHIAAPAAEGAPPPIAARGRPETGVPACLACHGSPVRGGAPRLEGQPADYLAAQLRLFRDGVRGGGPYASLMTRAAAELADEEIEALAAWFAGLAPRPAP